MDVNIALTAAGCAAALGLGAGASIRLIPAALRAGHALKAWERGIDAEIEEARADDEALRSRLARPKGRRRESSIVGLYGSAIRHADGSFTRAYHMELAPTVFSEDAIIEARYDGLARLLAARKPAGTVIQFRLSAGPDPGLALMAHADALDTDGTHLLAGLLHAMGMRKYQAMAECNLFRQTMLTAWVNVPNPAKEKESSGAFFPTFSRELRARGISGFGQALAASWTSSWSDGILRRIIEEEQTSFLEAEKTFRLIERESAVKLTRFSREETWSALYLGHRQNARSVPVLPNDGTDLRDYLCGETIESRGSYLMHGNYPVAVISLFVPPQPVVTADALRMLSINGNLNFRHTVVAEFITLQAEKAIKQLDRRIRQVRRSMIGASGRVRDTPEGRVAYADLASVREELAGGREALLEARFYVIVYGEAARNRAELEQSVAGLERYCEQVITEIRKIPGADAERAELLAAARLPEGAFKKNAGTDVVADIIILRKREAPIKVSSSEPGWIDVATLQLRHPQGELEEVQINTLFASQPHLMLGTPTLARGMYRQSEFSVEPDGRDTQTALGDSLVAQLPSQAMTPAAQLSLTAIEISVQAAGRTSVKDEAAEAFDLESLRGLDQMRATSLLELYTLAKKIISLQLIDAPDDILDVALKSLNEQYDRFRARFGCINSPENTRHVNKRSPVLPFLKALEEPTGKNSFRKTPFFTGRTIRPNKEVTHAATPKDALLHCLNERGRVEIPRIAALVGQSEQAVITALKGIIYETPSGCFETADEYLSGDVRSKLREAEAAAALNPRFEENVTALRDALPPLVEPGQIAARLGSGWIPTEVVEQFMHELIPDYQGKVKYIEALGTWTVESPGHYAASSIEATQVWGTSQRHAIQLIEDALNLHNPVVYDQVEINGQKKSVVNETETVAAQAKQAEIKLKFAAWLWEDHDRATRLAEIYNERYNCLRERRYDGSHLQLPGAATAIEPRPHQKDAIWRIVQSRTTLLGHCVGAGKTISMVAGARELKRLSVTHKAMAVVPNHLPMQWADEARRLYPDIKLLVPTKEELSREQRGELMSRVATGDWDLIIVPHTAFKMLPLQAATVREFIGREIAVLREYLEELGSNRDKLTRTTCKRIEAAIKKLETHLKDKESEISRDARATITWEELGVDALFVDEAAAYKNLHCPTKMSRIAGLPNSDSQRAFDLFMKVRTILDQGGRVVFATATPISNTIAEVFVMMKFLQLETLEQMGLAHFDAWAQAFAETSQGLEMKPDGSGFRVNTRFNRFTNLPELATLWRQVLDVRTAEQLNLPRPRVAGGGPVAVTIPASPELKQFTKSLAERVTRIKNRGVKPEDDNMLKITSEGRKAALDIRLVRPGLPEPADSKVNALVARIKEIYDRYHAQRAAQLVFSDIHCMKAK